MGVPKGAWSPVSFFFSERFGAQKVNYCGTLSLRDDTCTSCAEGGTGTSSSCYETLTNFVSVDEGSSETALGHFVSCEGCWLQRVLQFYVLSSFFYYRIIIILLLRRCGYTLYIAFIFFPYLGIHKQKFTQKP